MCHSLSPPSLLFSTHPSINKYKQTYNIIHNTRHVNNNANWFVTVVSEGTVVECAILNFVLILFWYDIIPMVLRWFCLITPRGDCKYRQRGWGDYGHEIDIDDTLTISPFLSPSSCLCGWIPSSRGVTYWINSAGYDSNMAEMTGNQSKSPLRLLLFPISILLCLFCFLSILL